MLAYYFSEQSNRLRYGDNRLIRVGTKHVHRGGPITLCEAGLHASAHVADALDHAPGPILWRVRLAGEIVRGDDKCVATERNYLARIDATELLREHARWCALRVAHLWDAPPIVLRYLRTGDESLRVQAARAAQAAWDATWAAARTARAARAARTAARATWDARDAARAAARAAWDARTAARAAWDARAAARAAALVAARDAARDATRAAALVAARDAARDAERKAQRSHLARVVNKAFANLEK